MVLRRSNKVLLAAVAALTCVGVECRFSGEIAPSSIFQEGLSNFHQNSPAQAGTSTEQTLDVSKWQKLKNVTGWVMRIPAGWEDKTPGEGDMNTSDLVYVQGPENCLTQMGTCAVVGVRRFSPNAGTSKQSLEAYLGINDPSIKSIDFLNQTKLMLAGEAALDVCTKDKTSGTVRSRQVVLKHRGALFDISYYEIGKNGESRLDVRSPQDWKYTAIFDKMLSTFSFYK